MRVRPAQLAGRALLVAAVLAAGTGVHLLTERNDYLYRPFDLDAAMGEPVQGRQLVITAVGVRGVPAVSVTEPLAKTPTVYGTAGVWVLVRVRVQAIREPARLGYGVLVDAEGRQYEASRRFEQPLMNSPVQPGIRREGELAFELPPDAARELTLLAGHAPLDRRLDSEARIALPRFTAETVRMWSEPQPAVPIRELT